MKELQNLIYLISAEKEKALKSFNSAGIGTIQEAYDYGKCHAFSFVIDEVEKLLKTEHGSNHGELPIDANTALGEVPPSVDTSTSELPAGNSPVKQGAVRQNEVAKEVCPHCTGGNIGTANGKLFCFDCEEWL